MNIPFPELRIVPIECILPHEEHDQQRALPLVEHIRRDGVLRNPPIVAPMDDIACDPNMVVLDGANRVYALRHLELDYALVQVVRYGSEMVRLETWAHVVSGVSTPELIELINELEDITLVEVSQAEAHKQLARREAILSLVIAAGTYVVRGGADLCTQSERLLRVVNAYQQHGILNRTTAKTLTEARPLFPNGAGLVVFPNYHPKEVIEAAREGAYLPAGVTRHIIKGRALHINYRLEELKNDEPAEVKNAHLTAWLQARAAEKNIRLYAEPTFLFDE